MAALPGLLIELGAPASSRLLIELGAPASSRLLVELGAPASSRLLVHGGERYDTSLLLRRDCFLFQQIIMKATGNAFVSLDHIGRM